MSLNCHSEEGKKFFFIIVVSIRLLFYASKVLKITETGKAKIAEGEEFALAETFLH